MEDEAEGSGANGTFTKLKAFRAVIIEHAVQAPDVIYDDILDLLDEMFPELTQ